jgi:hypothetical protein
MNRGSFLVTSGLAAVIAGVWLASTPVAVQSPPGTTTASSPPAVNGWTSPRTAWGDPDLEGIWSGGYILTPLERPEKFAEKPFLTDAEVVVLEEEAALTFGVGAGAGRVPRPPRGTEADVAGAYNDVFAGRGRKVVRTRRSSLIVDPANGKIAPLTPDGEKRAAVSLATNFASRSGGRADGPEDRTRDDRCFGPSLPVAFGHPATAGAHSRIVQTSGAVSIYYEQNRGGAYRTIPVDGRPHLPSRIRQWLGDARGRWEGTTLIVDTTNFTDRTNYYGARENLHLVERFTRVASDMIIYQATIDDPTTFTRPWTIEVPLTKADEKQNQIFENACHEGNYALTNILAGARAEERAAATPNGGRQDNLTSRSPSRARR